MTKCKLKKFKTTVNGISLFSNVGIDELFLKKQGINIVAANELLPERAKFYSHIYPHTKMICGDITEQKIFNKMVKIFKDNNCKFLLATPPCQGMSVAGKMSVNDPRNRLIKYVIKFIKIVKPDNVLIENVPTLLNFPININGKLTKISEYIINELSSEGYKIVMKVLDAADFNTPQHRKRAIILISKKIWNIPKKHKWITVRDVIGSLPSLTNGEQSSFHKYHRALTHNKNHILWMSHTPTGKTALNNKIYYPINKNGKKIKAFSTTYKRIDWDKPAPTVTMCNGAISSQNNVHPGRKLKNGHYSDPRALSILELMRISGIPDDWNIPKWASENLIRKVIGECFPPKFCECIVNKMPH